MEEKKKKKKKSFYFPALNEHVEFISFTILIHNSSEDNSVYFSVQLTRLQKKKLCLSRVLLLDLPYRKRKRLKEIFFEKIEFLLQLREGRFFLKNRTIFLCTQSRIYTSIDSGEEDTENTRNRLSAWFFFF